MNEVKRYGLQVLVPMEAPQDVINQTLEEAWAKQGIVGHKKMDRYLEAIVGPGMKRVTVWYDVEVKAVPPTPPLIVSAWTSEPVKKPRPKRKGKFDPELESK